MRLLREKKRERPGNECDGYETRARLRRKRAAGIIVMVVHTDPTIEIHDETGRIGKRDIVLIEVHGRAVPILWIETGHVRPAMSGTGMMTGTGVLGGVTGTIHIQDREVAPRVGRTPILTTVVYAAELALARAHGRQRLKRISRI
jgi:hypothetical protein